MSVCIRLISLLLSSFACMGYDHESARALDVDDAEKAFILSLLALSPTTGGQSSRNSQAQMSGADRIEELDRRTTLGLGAAAASATAIEPAFADGAVTYDAMVASISKAPKRQVLVTGCESAASLAAAKLLAFCGHEVLCTADDIGKARTAFRYIEDNLDRGDKKLRKGGTGEWAVLDPSDRLSINDLASLLKGTKLDSVIFNDEVTSSSLELTEDGFEKTAANNFLGNVALMNKLADIMPQYAKPQARIVLSVSPEHAKGSLGSMSGLAAKKFEMIDGGSFSSEKAFKDSELANMMAMGAAAKEFAGKMNVNAVYTDYKEPAPTETFPLKGGYRGYGGFVPKEAVFAAAVLAYMAVDPGLDSTTGKWYVGKTGTGLAEGTPSAAASDPEMQKKLWDLAVAATGVKGRFVSPMA